MDFRKLRYWLPAGIWLAFMFTVSSLQVTYETVRMSLLGRALTAIKRYLYRHSNTFTDYIVTNIDKIYHVFEYFIFTVLLYYAISRSFRMTAVKRFITVFGIVLGTSVIDELHQIFVPTRFCSFTDFLADMLGAAIMIMIILAIYFIRRKYGLQKD